MYFYILLPITALFLNVLYRSQAHLIIKNVAVIKYNKWKRLNTLVSSTENNNIRIAFISFKMVLRAFYIGFIQYMNNSVRQIDNKTYELTYVINGKIYKMIVTPKKGPAPILQISNDLENDVTDHVLPYMGPQYDWHGSRFNPEFFTYRSLTFELADGTEHTYEGNNDVDYNIKNKVK